MTSRFAWLLGMGLAAWACGSSATAQPCAPTQQITGGGTLDIVRGGTHTVYALATAQVEDFINSGSLTVLAQEDDAGTGGLGAQDPVAVVQMDPAPDKPDTYTLASLHAKVGFCATATSKLVSSGTGAISACKEPAGAAAAFVTEALDGNIVVDSGSQKSLDAPQSAKGSVSLKASFGQAAQTCQ